MILRLSSSPGSFTGLPIFLPTRRSKRPYAQKTNATTCIWSASEQVSAFDGAAGQPSFPSRVEGFYFRTLQPRHIGLHFVPDIALQVSQVAIAFRKALQQLLIELQQLARIHRVHAVLFVNGLPQYNAPAIAPL